MKYVAVLLAFIVGLIVSSVPLLIAAGLNQLVDLPTALVWASWILGGVFSLVYFVNTVIASVAAAVAVSEL